MKTRGMSRAVSVFAFWFAVRGVVCAGAAGADEWSPEYELNLARDLANPVASLINVPLQFNYDRNLGPAGDGTISRLNLQPVIPFSLNEDWNLITRTIVPWLDLNDLPVEGVGKSGLGDTLASQFLSPGRVAAGGWIWGAGPVWLLPTATDETLGTEKWGLGPTAVALRQQGPWTYGLLFNHVWSFAGDRDRADVNNSFFQPFLVHIFPTFTTVSLNTESTYDWESESWSVPVNFTVSQLLKVGGQIFQIGVGARYWAESPDAGAEDWGFRTTLTFLFPR